MSTLLIHRARCLATQDDAQTELHDAAILIRDGLVEHIFTADEPLDAWLAPGVSGVFTAALHRLRTNV